MAADDLTKPLGLTPPRGPRRRRFYFAIAGTAGLVAIGAVTWFLVSGSKGPTATAVINAPAVDAPSIMPARTGSIKAAPQTGSGLTEVTPDSGLTEVGSVVIHDPSEPQPVQLASAPEPELIEDSADGPLPRVSSKGIRPLDAYARPAAIGGSQTRIAIVIGGVGIDPNGTTQAIHTLPGTITLAFAPYGNDLAGAVAKARTAGHEILLQIPLEPFNYPKTDPGPHTLTFEATAAQNLDRLHWLLGRMTNYVGVVNYMGARFTSEVTAMKPVINEIGHRGLLYLDDGSSARSKAGDVAAGTAPFLRADIVLDADLSAAAIDERLRQLQAIAKERGYAVATGTAFPVTIERVAAFARMAADKGIAIVPVSALAGSRS